MKKLLAAPILIAATPLTAFADSATTVSGIAGIFNIFVGLMLVTAILMWIAGMIMWSVRLGTFPSYRDEAIEMLERAVAVMFVLVVILGIVQYFQRNTQIALAIVGVAVVGLVAWAIITSGVFSSAGEKEEH